MTEIFAPDATDIAILKLLARDATPSAAEVGRAVGLTQPAAWRRIDSPPGRVPPVARPRSMQSRMTCQIRRMPLEICASERCARSFSRFMAAMDLPDFAAISSISAALAKG